MKKFYKQVVCLNEENLILKIWIFINRRWELLNTNVTNNTMMRVISNESFTRVLENNSRILVVLITINPPEDAKYRLARARGRQYFWYFQAILSISV